MIISDACLGLVKSLGDFYPQAKWQRYMVHFYRKIFSHIPRAKINEITMMLKAIHATRKKASAVVAKLRKSRFQRAAQFVEVKVEETLTYYSFPSSHWRRTPTNNPLERIMREICRRTNVVGAFPDSNSALILVAARLRHITGTKWSLKRYLNMDLLREMEIEGQIKAI